ncbi:1,4-dihydroxy-2-naphthoate octaprenyltransferase [Pseudarcicella hirudinis]|uniref:1,4-dihydroxy-2-naphthoate octaprenyltransferase n=1 Tax=Pseudarcicella hirudinis TaxID=1079859 RepID=A0A1I5WRL1_9BACT|nr:UbiA family prenyltransferase [Pseudarcicella hirudinis]SFQ22442.1 1,4-dihydroxy-2-naphthoate octaprenyltransferase [Pseudarcicella hirudinis]
MKNIILHLRFPFSFFLLPVFVFAWSQAHHPDTSKTIWIFFLLHLLIYPASNAYNSYFDKDEGAIGGLENPPPVDKNLFYTAWIFDLIAIILAMVFVGKFFAEAILLYGLVSKAYSNDKIRLKKYPIISWLTIGVFQGAFIYLASLQALDNLALQDVLKLRNIFPAILTSLNLLGFYPMTQIYQHDEDEKRGDFTISRLLGIRGTFLFTATLFLFASGGFFVFFQGKTIFNFPAFVLYLLTLSPTLLFFGYWFFITLKNEKKANFKNTMLLNLLGSMGLNAFFLILLFSKK